MAEQKFKLYGYRWVVLAVTMFINLTIQILWIGYAPIATEAAKFYGVTEAQIVFLGMTFMIAFIPLSIPVSWIIDRFGFRAAVSIGAVLMGVFGLVRGFAGANYTIVLWSTIGVAVAQPFLLNAWTKMPANWFGMDERATAVGLVTLASLLGTGLGMAVTPILTSSYDIPTVQLIYGAITALSSVLFLVFARENPPTPPCPPGQEVRSLMLDGLKSALRIKSFWFFLGIFFVAMAIFNGVTSWVDVIIRPRGFTAVDVGTAGALMLAGGIVGAIVIPPFSDKQHKRKIYLLVGFLFAIPCLLGLTFATNAILLFLSSFFLGVCLVGVSPIGFQYAAEITQPTPEGTSNGLLQLVGQLSVVVVYNMDRIKAPDGSLTPALIFASGLLVLSVLLITQLKDPKFAK